MQVHYIVLDDVFWFGGGYIGYLDADQLLWLERDLQTLEPGRTVVVFTHIPMLSTQFCRRGDANPDLGTSVSNRDMLYRLLEPFKAHVMSGHTLSKNTSMKEAFMSTFTGRFVGLGGVEISASMARRTDTASIK